VCVCVWCVGGREERERDLKIWKLCWQGIPGDRESQAVVDPPPQAVSTGTPQSPAVAAAAATTTATTTTTSGGKVTNDKWS
jgi:hypothetical protein